MEALKGISMSVKPGELFGVIGPDGAGKTTLFRLVASLLKPTSGSISVLGLDPVKEYRELRQRIGYMPGRFSLYPDLSVEENLNFFATVFGTTIEENYSLIKDVYHMLEPFKTRLAGNLSGGMKQKLALSCALIHKPDLLILDEPTTGVDAVSRKEFWEMLKGLKSAGITIVVSTPYMDEASLCDRVALMQDGEILTQDTPANITRNFGKPLYSVANGDIYSLIKLLRSFGEVVSAFAFGQDVHVVLNHESQRNAVEAKLKAGGRDAALMPIEASIEDCFMHLMSSSETTKRG